MHVLLSSLGVQDVFDAAAFGVAAQPPAAARAQAVPLLDDSRVGHPTTRVQQQKRHLLPGRTRVLDEEAAARALQKLRCAN